MCKLYKTIEKLCQEKGITGYKMCKDCGLYPSLLTDLKNGRKKTLSSNNSIKIANYFGVSVNFLLNGREEQKKPTTENGDELTEEQKYLIDIIPNLSDSSLKILKAIVEKVLAEEE